MNETNHDRELLTQFDALINGRVTEAEHHALQQRLKKDAGARALFRERMDLEASLRAWATESTSDADVPAVSTRRCRFGSLRATGRWQVSAAVVATLLLLLGVWWRSHSAPLPDRLATDDPPQNRPTLPEATLIVGRIIEPPGCVWSEPALSPTERLTTGKLSLAAGVAEVKFDSGTNVILEAPCELEVESADSARLLAGSVFVDVTEVSHGFTLRTHEARILDEGTQYAVTLDAEAVEVHVFDGSVIWIPEGNDAPFEDRIESGEAKQYQRAAPNRPHHIPFGQRQFTKRIDADVRNAGGTALVAYDGFENLAGQLRRGRSGFGWSGGWQSVGRRGRGPLASIVDAPSDVVFGIQRAGHRLLSLNNGDDLRRTLESPLQLHDQTTLFVSLLASRQSRDGNDGTSLQVSLEPESNTRRPTHLRAVSFGVTSDGFPFVNNAGRIQETGSVVFDLETCLFVFKYSADDQSGSVSMRVYRPGEPIDRAEPSVWTVVGDRAPGPQNVTSLRLTVGQHADWQVDELKIGTSWPAIFSEDHEQDSPPSGEPQR